MTEQVNITVTDLIPPSNIATIDKDGLVGNAVSKEQLDSKTASITEDYNTKIAEVRAEVNTDFRGTLNPTDTAPTEDGSYKPEIASSDDKPSDPNSTADWGKVYPNAGNLRAKTGYETMFYKKGSVWTRSEVKMPEPLNKIDTWSAQSYPIGKQVIYSDQSIYESTSATTPSDTPGLSSKWKAVVLNEKAEKEFDVTSSKPIANSAVTPIYDWFEKEGEINITTVNFSTNDTETGLVYANGTNFASVSTGRRTPFIFVKAGTTITGLFFLGSAYNAISFYSSASISSYVEGVPGVGSDNNTGHTLNYTVTTDGFVRLSASEDANRNSQATITGPNEQVIKPFEEVLVSKTDKDFDVNSDRPIANSTVAPIYEWLPKDIISDTTVTIGFTSNVNSGYINDQGIAVAQAESVNNRYTGFIPVLKGDLISGIAYLSSTPNAISFYTAADESTYVAGVKGTGSSQSSPGTYSFVAPDNGFVRFTSSTLGTGSFNIRTIVYGDFTSLQDYVKEVMEVPDTNLVDSKRAYDLRMNPDTKLFEAYRGGFSQFCRLRPLEKCFYKSSHNAFFLKDTGERVDMALVNGLYVGEFTADASGNFYTANRFSGDFYLKKQEYELFKGKRILKGGSIIDDEKCNVIKFLYVPGMDVLNIKTKRPPEYPFIVRQGQTWGFEDSTSEEVSFFFNYSSRATIYVNCYDLDFFEFNRTIVPRETRQINNGDNMLIGSELYSYNFGDEFAGTTLDLKKWKYRTGEKSNGNNVKEAITFGGGNLKIRVWANTPGNTTYIQDENGNNTGTLTTKPFNGGGIISLVDDIQYGYFEASIKMPSSYYMHSSFWTTQSFLNSGESSLTKNEIDIVEFDMKSNTVATGFNMLSAIHRWTPSHASLGYGAKVDYFNTTMNDYTQNFNRFGCLVTEDFIAMYFNGVLVNTITYKELIGFSVNPCEIILSCLPYTSPDLLGKPEDFMEVEYVRYYKAND